MVDYKFSAHINTRYNKKLKRGRANVTEYSVPYNKKARKTGRKL